MTATNNDLKKFWFCPGCFAELSLEYSGEFGSEPDETQRCPVCRAKLLDVPSQHALWDVRYHAVKLHEALHPVGKEKEGGEE